MHQAVEKLRDPKSAEDKDMGVLTGPLENRTMSEKDAQEYMHSCITLYGNMVSLSCLLLH